MVSMPGSLPASDLAFCLCDPLVSALHGLPRYQPTSRLIAVIAGQPLVGPDRPEPVVSQGRLGRRCSIFPEPP
jgi:hypothetical protein